MWAVALFADALVEKDRLDWSEHHASTNGAAPTRLRQLKGSRANRKAISKTSKTRLTDGFWGVLEQQSDWRDEQYSFYNFGGYFVLFISSDFSFIAWSKKIFGFH